jgi:hypothetical protein
MIAAGVPLPVCMSITGHKTISMFKRYAIVDASLQRQALEAVAKHQSTIATPAKVVAIKSRD